MVASVVSDGNGAQGNNQVFAAAIGAYVDNSKQLRITWRLFGPYY
jgi:hypothetical protein